MPAPRRRLRARLIGMPGRSTCKGPFGPLVSFPSQTADYLPTANAAHAPNAANPAYSPNPNRACGNKAASPSPIVAPIGASVYACPNRQTEAAIAIVAAVAIVAIIIVVVVAAHGRRISVGNNPPRGRHRIGIAT